MNLRFWKGFLTASVVAVAIQAVLELWWQPINLPSVFPGSPSRMLVGNAWLLALLESAVIVAISVYVMCEFLEKLARAQNKKPLKHGAQFGFVFGVAQSVRLFLLPVAFAVLWTWTTLDVVASMIAFAAAAWIYQRIDPGPAVRGELNKRYLQSRKRL